MFTKIFLYLHSETVSGFGIVRGVAQPGLEYASGGRVVASSNLVTPTISFKESTGRLTPCPFKFSIGLCTAVRSVLDAWIAVSSRAGYKFDPRAAAPDVSVSRGRYLSDYPFNGGLPILFYMLSINWLWYPEALRQIFFRNRSYSRVGLLFFCVSL